MRVLAQGISASYNFFGFTITSLEGFHRFKQHYTYIHLIEYSQRIVKNSHIYMKLARKLIANNAPVKPAL